MPSRNRYVPNHRLEARASLLAQRLQERAGILATALKPPGSRPLFTETLSEKDALVFWGQNRYSELGKQILGTWAPEQVAELDAALGQTYAQQPAAAQAAVQMPSADAGKY